MTTHLTAMATALAVRNACARQIDRDRPLDNLDLDAIVRRVIQAHRGHIALDNREGGGLRVTVVLPRMF